ncbi:MAG: peptidoglycan DD-metalloendopeptidase family protein, partial [Desulfobulbaceae bacterium]|nr:peptidoglycan DD-metalloendopeptidase family protein [Desulfobulbaceae bacterium]
GPYEVEETVVLDPKKTGLKDGKAELVVAVRDFSLNGKFKGNENIIRLPVIIDTKPPRVTVDHAQLYIRSGGSGIVIYNLSEATDRHGVKIDDTFFQGYPMQNLKNRYIAYIALPWDAKEPESTRVVAIDEAGNEGKSIFSMHFKKVPEKKDRINISDGFLKRKIPEFEEHYPEMSGSMLDKFLFVNNEVRKQNAQTVYEACKNPLEEQLWQDKFLRMAGANRAGFADQRTYNYQGKTIDHQTHLGVDIASTARVPIKAANRGKVVFAEYLGIYGNTVILDHGQGIVSLYSHLSRIDTAVGTVVEKNKLIGHTGVSGMAGGDHLHFSMLVHGICVTPVEWWDQHWIDVNIKNLISGN